MMQSSTKFLFYSTSTFPRNLTYFPPPNLVFCKDLHYRQRMAYLTGLRVKSQFSSGGPSDSNGGEENFKTLIDFIGKDGENVGDDMVILISHLQYACKRIAAVISSPFNSVLGKKGFDSSSIGDRDAPKPLDIVSNEIILSSLRNSGKAAVMASEEDDVPVWITDDGPFVVKAQLNSLQNGGKLIAAGYVLYSSATILCVSFGSGTHAFTLDHITGDFVLTHPRIKVPPRGQIYSVNDARYFDWPEGLRKYINTVRQGKGKFPNKYLARYISSLVADFHRTLMYGGVTMNPRDHLRLVYEANPLSFLVEQAGGRGSDGNVKILSIQPLKLQQRLPLFLSLEDMEELESYGDVQQKINPGYEV
ncbi:hypothetical protein MKX01_014635 [Papaver californicum]|nr:hypothetical protein MKX01_014635 [Papaver californicum]